MNSHTICRVLRSWLGVLLMATSPFASAAPAAGSAVPPAAALFPLSTVRLTGGPLLAAQQRDQAYVMGLDADRLLAPFRREAGLPLPKPSYGNWESTGLDGHMGGHYLSALAMLAAATGDAAVRARLDHVVAELKRCQDAHGDGYLGGIPGGRALWTSVARGEVKADNFALNGAWVPWYNLHKTFAGLRDAWQLAGHAGAREMLVKLADWAVRTTEKLDEAQMQQMLRTEHGGMNEVLADVYQLTGEARFLQAARRFSHRQILDPLAAGEDRLTGLHANTQIPKVIGFQRIAELDGTAEGRRAARFFWDTVHDQRSVAIGGNSVKEHFHSRDDFRPMIEEVEGPETCNTYNMLRLTGALFRERPSVRLVDYAERAIFNHILSSQHPEHGGLVYFTPMRPNHYRVYSRRDEGMWCCVGSGLESHAKYGELVYGHEAGPRGAVLVNLFVDSTLDAPGQGVKLQQSTGFPDEAATRITVQRTMDRPLVLRYPGWVRPGALTLAVNGVKQTVSAKPGEFIRLERRWAAGDTVALTVPMHSRLEPLPDGDSHFAVLHGPIVLAARTVPIAGEKLDFTADGSRLGHIASGPVCALDATPFFITDAKAFLAQLKAVKGKPLTFTASGVVQGQARASVELMPFFRLHDARYEVYWPHASPQALAQTQARLAEAERERAALDAITLDQVAPGEQQPESDHGYRAEGADTGLNGGKRWRHATGWFGYRLADPQRRARTLRLWLSPGDAGRQWWIELNGQRIDAPPLRHEAPQPLYTLDVPLPPALVRASGGALEVRFVAAPGSMAGGLYGLRLLSQ